MPKAKNLSRRSWAQRLVISVNCLLVIACIGAGLGLMRVRQAIESLPVVDIGSSLAPSAVESSAPRNVLIIGTDNAEGIDKNDPVMKNRAIGTSLADVIMILRVDPRDHSVKLLSIPRDSRVELPSGRMGRINAAMAGVGGEANLVRTIKHNFGIPIDNYIQLDFLGFRKLVEVLGGVPVYFTTPVRDRNSGLAISEAGCHVLNPDQALAYARSRHFYFYKDGKWRPDGSGDLGRITRQQDFIKRALRSAAEHGLRNPTTALSLVNAAASAVRMDSTLDVGTLVGLVRQFQDFNPDALQSMQVPTKYAPRGGVAYQDILWDEAEGLLEQFRGVDDPQALKPGDIIVGVAGGTSKTTDTTAVESALDAAGFNADQWKSGSKGKSTVVSYGLLGREAAIILASNLESMPQFKFDASILGYQVRINLGTDFTGVRKEPLSLSEMNLSELPPPVKADQPKDSSTTEPQSNNDEVDETIPAEELEPSDEPDVDQEAPGVVPTDPAASALCR
ncbi:MAG: LCP family protein [Microthrixaceae bacterium]|nr:LCP family protein [Microthrixaceae bacterium]